MKKLIFFCLYTFCFLLPAFSQEKLPKVVREFRGMWIATVENLDFPSKRDLNADQQKAELIKLLDLAAELKMNAVIFQIRPIGDALYSSDIEPSSPYLTGEMGKRPDFDPFKFLIEESHARGILVHAWINPYRMSHPSFKGPFSDQHPTKKHPEWVREYKPYMWLDPGLKEVQDYLVNIIGDVVKRYDMDGVHFDDYFYPYPSSTQPDFPDSETYEAYKKTGGELGKGDWRRKNVDDFVQQVSIEIKKIKPQIMFGISPFGIWKPDDIEIKGTSAYDALYADSRKWFQEGWIDYLAPQLYWSTTNNKGQAFERLLNWWHKENRKKRHLWAGIAPYRVGDDKFPDFPSPKEIETQIGLTRRLLNDTAGTIHFRALSYHKIAF